MSNSFYNPYDQNIQWGEGIADFIEQNRDMLMSIFGGGGNKRVKGNQPTGPQAMGQPNMGPVGGGIAEDQGQLMGDIMGGGAPMGMMGSPGGGSPTMNFQGGSPAQFGGGQGQGMGGGTAIGQTGLPAMDPEQQKRVAWIMQQIMGQMQNAPTSRMGGGGFSQGLRER